MLSFLIVSGYLFPLWLRAYLVGSLIFALGDGWSYQINTGQSSPPEMRSTSKVCKPQMEAFDPQTACQSYSRDIVTQDAVSYLVSIPAGLCSDGPRRI